MNGILQHPAKLGILFSVLIFSLFWQLGSWGVTESSEARYAEIAREMLETQNWLLPQYLQILHFDKPLMTYWITAGGLKIFGINAFGVRFFLQIAYLLQIFLVFKITRELFENKNLATYAAFIYCGIPLVLISIRNLTTDAYLNTFALLAVLCYIQYYKHTHKTWLYLFFTAIGLTIFTKGPFGLLLPLLAIYPLQQLLKPIRNNTDLKIKSFHIYLGILLSIIIGGWWFFYLLVSSAKFYNFFIIEQLINRVANAQAMKRSEPFWYYFILLPLFILPMLSLFIGSLTRYLKQKTGALKWLIAMTIIAPLLLFSISSSKLILYILPISPFIAIITAHYLYNLDPQEVKKHFTYVLCIYCLIAIAIIVLCFGLIPQIDYHGNFLQYILVLLLLLYILYVSYKLENYKQKILLLFLITPAFILPISSEVLKKMELDINSLTPISRFIKSKHMENRHIIVWNRAVNSIPFELQKEVYSIKFEHYSLFRKTQFQHDMNWKKYLIDVNQKDEIPYLNTLLASPSVFITRDKLPKEYIWLIKPYQQQKAFGEWTLYY
jgi:4-amino-4-deoxy-L-arabinose transferase-like glycosyltransferase